MCTNHNLPCSYLSFDLFDIKEILFKKCFPCMHFSRSCLYKHVLLIILDYNGNKVNSISVQIILIFITGLSKQILVIAFTYNPLVKKKLILQCIYGLKSWKNLNLIKARQGPLCYRSHWVSLMQAWSWTDRASRPLCTVGTKMGFLLSLTADLAYVKLNVSPALTLAAFVCVVAKTIYFIFFMFLNVRKLEFW